MPPAPYGNLSGAVVVDERSQVILHFNGFRLDVGRAQLVNCSGAALEFRPKSFDLLRYLIENPDRIVSRDELMEAVWPGVFVTDDAITQCVAEIRRALSCEGPRLVRTGPKRGYIFTVVASDPATGTPAAAILVEEGALKAH